MSQELIRETRGLANQLAVNCHSAMRRIETLTKWQSNRVLSHWHEAYRVAAEALRAPEPPTKAEIEHRVLAQEFEEFQKSNPAVAPPKVGGSADGQQRSAGARSRGVCGGGLTTSAPSSHPPTWDEVVGLK